MKKLITIVIVLILGCNVQRKDKDLPRIDSLADKYLKTFLEISPFSSYFLDIPLNRHDGINSNDLQMIQSWQGFEDSLYTELLKVDESKILPRNEKVTYWLLKEGLESSISMRICKSYYWDVNHLSGWQVVWSSVAEFQPVGTEEFRNQAMKRWSELQKYVDTEISNLQKGISEGYTMPRKIVELVIDQLQTILDYDLEKSPLMSPAIRDGDIQFYSEWKTLVKECILPAISKYQTFLKTEYINKARTESSILFLPNGNECYQAYIRSNTSIKKSGNEIYELGQQIVESNKRRVIELGIKSFGISDYLKIMKITRENNNNNFHNGEELLQFSRNRLSVAKETCNKWFVILPTKDVKIKPYEPYESGLGQYEMSQGNEPAYFKINLRNPEQQHKNDIEVTTYHETYPGHHLQMGIQDDIEGLHPVCKIFLITSFIEGWARYSEQLAEEMGLYETKEALIKRILWPARGMVVDPGVHLKGWSKEQAVKYIMDGGWSESDAVDIYYRIIVWPGQLTAYDVGGEEIKSLRRIAENRLKDSFNVQEFHTKILENGSIPLSNLHSTIEEWLTTH